jgi:hypothetical protein
MKKRPVIILGLALLGFFFMGALALAGPIPPAEKQVGVTSSDPAAVAARWYLSNGAFDESWDGDVPRSWQVYPGNADAFGALDFLDPSSGDELSDNAFVFHIVNDEVEADRNAYLYQTLALPRGDYWINVHSTIYGTGTGVRRSGGDVPDAYTYMAYYALVPQDEALREGVLAPAEIDPGAWRELWPWSTVCSEKVRGWEATDRPSECDYVKRAETVSVAGGAYVFVLRAELKWPDWRAFAYYIFDDLQVISATPLEDNWNACVTSFCLEGLIER